LNWAAKEAAYRGAVLRVVHTLQPSYVDGPLPAPADAIGTIHREARAVLEQAISSADIESNIETESVAATGSPESQVGALASAASRRSGMLGERTGRG
jgi:hypothetical protein